jgi:hypothetical protein
MVQSLTDQFAAYQRDHPLAPVRPPGERIGAASAAMLGEVVMLVRRLQADLSDLRHGLRPEIWAGAVTVDDEPRHVMVVPVETTVERCVRAPRSTEEHHLAAAMISSSPPPSNADGDGPYAITRRREGSGHAP